MPQPLIHATWAMLSHGLVPELDLDLLPTPMLVFDLPPASNVRAPTSVRLEEALVSFSREEKIEFRHSLWFLWGWLISCVLHCRCPWNSCVGSRQCRVSLGCGAEQLSSSVSRLGLNWFDSASREPYGGNRSMREN